MVESTGSVKVPNGKLVRVTVRHDDGIGSVRIRGDFFLEPPEALADLEAAVESLSVDASREEVAEAVSAVDAELIGFGPEDVADATVEALR
jgi:hypothetical protein